MTRRDLLRLAGGIALGTVFGGCGLRGLAKGRPMLRVWSCGGNYDLLMDFHRWFEAETGCSVIYTSAPVERMISIIAANPRGVDVLVGRSSPGWQDLAEGKRLASKPQVFALDPYVIIAPLGNPAGINGIEDLKRPDVRTVYSPTSSGPSGKVVQYLLEAADRVVGPGIWNGYVRNAIEAHDCGWKVFPPVIEGRADASITRLSMTTARETRGKLEVIPVPVNVMAAMREGQGAIPQRVAPLADGSSPELARCYVKALVGEPGVQFCARHGYIHRLSAETDAYSPLFQMEAGPRRQRASSQESGR